MSLPLHDDDMSSESLVVSPVSPSSPSSPRLPAAK